MNIIITYLLLIWYINIIIIVIAIYHILTPDMLSYNYYNCYCYFSYFNT